jgi:hypothetical protein
MIDIIRRTGISLLAGFLVRTDAGRLPFTRRLRLFQKTPCVHPLQVLETTRPTRSVSADRPRSPSGRGAPDVSRFSCMLFLGVRGF